LIFKRLKYSKKFKSDVWNLRLLTQVFVFNKKKDFSFPQYAKASYKYFFYFFFKLFKKKKRLRKLGKRPFIYRIDLLRRKVVRKRLKWRFITLRLVKFYYSLLSYKQFRKLARLAKKKDGLFENNYILALEGRLVNFLYRTCLIESIFKSFFFIKSGFITLN
jgi:ribosomal protein S4